MSDSRPLGFFDSGLGGLTVLSTVLKKFPTENYVYLGDTARLPYGTKSPDTIRRYAFQCIDYLLKKDVKAVVVACNSASTVFLKSIAAHSMPEFPVPIYNVIEPGAETALQKSKTKRIGVLGTRATVTSMAYPKAIVSRDPAAVVFQNAAPLLVPLVEEGWEQDPLTNLIIYRYVAPLLEQSIDTLILGCTHYPALRDGLERATRSVNASVELVDSAALIAEKLELDFESGQISRHADDANNRPAHPAIDLYATDANPAMNKLAKRLLGTQEDSISFKACDL